MNKAGIDIVDISRFRRFKKDREHAFLKKAFSAREIEYCFKYADPAPHLGGLFAAKEAASKALGVSRFPFVSLEIRHSKDGAPEVWKAGRKLSVSVSVSHSAGIAAAIAIR